MGGGARSEGWRIEDVTGSSVAEDSPNPKCVVFSLVSQPQVFSVQFVFSVLFGVWGGTGCSVAEDSPNPTSGNAAGGGAYLWV